MLDRRTCKVVHFVRDDSRLALVGVGSSFFEELAKAKVISLQQ